MRIISSGIVSFGLLVPAFVAAQQISGRVLNEGGKAATHVKVQFKSKPGIVTTNTEGKFTITAKELPDTLLFYSAGFEPYNVIVTDKTVTDSSFEIVMLSTRSKASITTPVGGNNHINTIRNTSPKTITSSPSFKAFIPVTSSIVISIHTFPITETNLFFTNIFPFPFPRLLEYPSA